jgi:hypothetical protein
MAGMDSLHMGRGLSMSFQPRYLAYCQAHGKTPDEMMQHDIEAYPGGCMTGFILWSGEQLAKARKEHPDWFLNSTLHNHAEYDSWLQKEVSK